MYPVELVAVGEGPEQVAEAFGVEFTPADAHHPPGRTPDERPRHRANPGPRTHRGGKRKAGQDRAAQGVILKRPERQKTHPHAPDERALEHGRAFLVFAEHNLRDLAERNNRPERLTQFAGPFPQVKQRIGYFVQRAPEPFTGKRVHADLVKLRLVHLGAENAGQQQKRQQEEGTWFHGAGRMRPPEGRPTMAWCFFSVAAVVFPPGTNSFTTNDKNMKKTNIALALLMALSLTTPALAQQASTQTNVGNMSMEDLRQKNQKGSEAVAAVKPTSTPLSDADKALMMEVAKGGMMQLEVSRLASGKTTNDAVRMLAQAEVDEQTGLSAKLGEIAAAKGVTLPTTPDADTQSMLSRLQALSGSDFDRMYVQESGVNGHVKLDNVMTQVRKNANDKSLKDLADAAHPLVKTHLKVAQDMMQGMRSRMGNR